MIIEERFAENGLRIGRQAEHCLKYGYIEKLVALTNRA